MICYSINPNTSGAHGSWIVFPCLDAQPLINETCFIRVPNDDSVAAAGRGAVRPGARPARASPRSIALRLAFLGNEVWWWLGCGLCLFVLPLDLLHGCGLYFFTLLVVWLFMDDSFAGESLCKANFLLRWALLLHGFYTHTAASLRCPGLPSRWLHRQVAGGLRRLPGCGMSDVCIVLQRRNKRCLTGIKWLTWVSTRSQNGRGRMICFSCALLIEASYLTHLQYIRPPAHHQNEALSPPAGCHVLRGEIWGLPFKSLGHLSQLSCHSLQSKATPKPPGFLLSPSRVTCQWQKLAGSQVVKRPGLGFCRCEFGQFLVHSPRKWNEVVYIYIYTIPSRTRAFVFVFRNQKTLTDPNELLDVFSRIVIGA